MRLDKWQDLPNILKVIVNCSCDAVYIESLAEFLHYNSLSLEELKKKHKVKSFKL